MHCTNCGKEVPETALVCGYCGTRLKPAATPIKYDTTDASLSLSNSGAPEVSAQPQHNPPVESSLNGSTSKKMQANARHTSKGSRLWLFFIIPLGVLFLFLVIYFAFINPDFILVRLPEEWVSKPIMRERIVDSFDNPEKSVLPLDENRWITAGEYHWRNEGGGFSSIGLPYTPTTDPFWLWISWQFISTESSFSSWGVDIIASNADETEFQWYQINFYPGYYSLYYIDQDNPGELILEKEYETYSGTNNGLTISVVPDNCLMVTLNDDESGCFPINTLWANYPISLSVFNDTEVIFSYIALHDIK